MRPQSTLRTRVARGSRRALRVAATTAVATLVVSLTVALGTAGAVPSATPARTSSDGGPVTKTTTPPLATVTSTPSPPGTVADNRVLVGVSPNLTSAQRAALVARVAGELDGGTPSVVIVRVPGDVARAAAVLAAAPGVAYATPNHVLHATAAVAPNDPQFAQQWALPAAEGGIDATDAWATTTGSRAVVVATLDTGADLTHPDLAANLWTNPGGVGGCPAGTHGYNVFGAANAQRTDCTPQDADGHGTHVAGIIGAVGDNGVGVTGVNQRVSVLPIEMLDPSGDGSSAGAVQAIEWAVAATRSGVNIRVLNASWAGPDNDPALYSAIRDAANAGILFVAAAGNSGANVDGSSGDGAYPCQYSTSLPNVVCVAASDQTGNLAYFSNYGPSSVNLAAPGVSILSTWTGGGYAFESGTSMATPFVSGAAALTLAVQNQSVTQLRATLLGAVDHSASLVGQVTTGGHLDVCKAVPGCSVTAAGLPTAPSGFAAVRGNGTVTLTWSPPASPGKAPVSGYTVSGPGGFVATLPPTTTRTVVTGVPAGTPRQYSVTATNSAGLTGSPATVWAQVYSGGYVVDGWGGLHPFTPPGASAPPLPVGAPYWPNWDIVRGLALTPDGTGGYTLDAWGGIHPFALGTAPTPPPASGNLYLPGWDWARGIALTPDGSGGYVVDAFGGLHPFALGARGAPPAPVTTARWPTWPIARGVAMLPDGSGGYVLDGWGGLHPFALPGRAMPPTPTLSEYWQGWDIARGVAMLPDGSGGYVLDGWGGLHPFSAAGTAPGPAGGSTYWPGWDIARSVSL